MKKYIALAIAVVVLSGGAFWSEQWFVENYTDTREQGTISIASNVDGTVLDAMHAQKAEGTLSFSGREFPGLGFFVEEINGKRSADGYYWILYVNGTLSQTGVSQTFLSAGDLIEWRYEKGY
ncbi:DUF4430 domain-containing protein [Candidatus Kaiserbacteria bacterium]|nr:DUF4430 domain-containing protein [Candidatus Kaiserbacteria bacterium]